MFLSKYALLFQSGKGVSRRSLQLYSSDQECGVGPRLLHTCFSSLGSLPTHTICILLLPTPPPVFLAIDGLEINTEKASGSQASTILTMAVWGECPLRSPRTKGSPRVGWAKPWRRVEVPLVLDINVRTSFTIIFLGVWFGFFFYSNAASDSLGF